MGKNVSNVIRSYIFPNIFKSLYVNARRIWAPSPSEALVSLAATVSEEQIRQGGDQKETHHHGPDDNGNDPLVIVGPTLHFWNRQTEKVSVLLTEFFLKLLPTDTFTNLLLHDGGTRSVYLCISAQSQCSVLPPFPYCPLSRVKAWICRGTSLTCSSDDIRSWFSDLHLKLFPLAVLNILSWATKPE